MECVRHGLSVGIERTGTEFYLSIKICGKLTHHDYEVITPMLDAAVEGIAQPRIKALVDATGFEGWELRAAWDDLKLGVRHGKEFSRIALVGTAKWQEYAEKIGSWFISGEIRSFDNVNDGLAWLEDN